MTEHKTFRIILLFTGAGFLAFTAYLLLAPAITTVYDRLMPDPASVGEVFLDALQAKEHETAFDMLHADIQNELGTPEKLALLVGPSEIREWLYEIHPAPSENNANVVVLDGILTLNTGTEVKMQIILQMIEAEYKIVGYTFQPAA